MITYFNYVQDIKLESTDIALMKAARWQINYLIKSMFAIRSEASTASSKVSCISTMSEAMLLIKFLLVDFEQWWALNFASHIGARASSDFDWVSFSSDN